jgi:energy-converting hydrogenase Eha subunit H
MKNKYLIILFSLICIVAIIRLFLKTQVKIEMEELEKSRQNVSVTEEIQKLKMKNVRFIVKAPPDTPDKF